MDMPLARIHRLALPMLRCQLAKLREPGAGGAADKWRKALVAEVKALEADRYRLPWRDGVPAVLEASLKPYRERLEAGGLVCSGVSPDGRLVEFIELPGHPFWVGTQAHPEFKSRPDQPHPLFRELVGAALARAEGRDPHLIDIGAVG